MTVLGFWLLALAIYALVAIIGGRRLIPIVGQLLVAAIAVPALLLLWVEPHWQLSAQERDDLAPSRDGEQEPARGGCCLIDGGGAELLQGGVHTSSKP